MRCKSLLADSCGSRPGFGLKSRLPIDWPTAGVGFRVGRAFVPNPVNYPLRARPRPPNPWPRLPEPAPCPDSATVLVRSSSPDTDLIPAIILPRFSGFMVLPDVARSGHPVLEQGPQCGPHAEPDVVVEVRRPALPGERRRAGRVHLDNVFQASRRIRQHHHDVLRQVVRLHGPGAVTAPSPSQDPNSPNSRPA